MPKQVLLTSAPLRLCMIAMWLDVLRNVLYALAALTLCAVAFAAGIFTARHTVRPPAPTETLQTPPEQREEARQQVEDALAARFTGDNAKAIGLFDQAAATDPSFKGLDFQKGVSFLQMGDFAKAEAAANASLEKGEETANANALLIMCATGRIRAGEKVDSARVEEWARQARTKDPLAPFVHYAMGEYSRAIGQPRDAVDHYRKALERVSAADSLLVSTVKAGLAGIRLEQNTGGEVIAAEVDLSSLPPEELFFGAARSLLAGDTERAKVLLERAREVLRPEVFSALIRDSFFQDFLPEGIVSDPQ